MFRTTAFCSVLSGTTSPKGTPTGAAGVGAGAGLGAGAAGCGAIGVLAGAVVAAAGAGAGVGVLPAAASTSSATIRPWGPLPFNVLRSTFSSLANLRARGETIVRPLRWLVVA